MERKRFEPIQTDSNRRQGTKTTDSQRSNLDTNLNFAGWRGELEGISHQISENLPQPRGISPYNGGNVFREPAAHERQYTKASLTSTLSLNAKFGQFVGRTT